MSKTISETLSEYFASLRFEDLPAATVDSAVDLLLDYTGVSIRGSRTDSGTIVSDFAVETGGHPQSSVIGRREKAGVADAAFANAVCAHSIELDDVDDLALFHFSPPIISAALAAGEVVSAGGRQLMTAIVAGCEMMARVSNAANPSLRNRGFHSTPTCGVFGATVAAAKLMGLTSQQMVWALGLAGAQASGLMEMYGKSMQKRVNPGPAARNAVTACMLARRGFTGAETIFEGERGFGKAFCDTFAAEKMTEGLGKEIPVRIEFKPYSCARPIHNAIDCALDIRRREGFDVNRISSIKVWRHPMWAHYHLNKSPRSFHEAQVSLPYSAAVALVDGAALLDQYSKTRLTDPLVCRLASMMEIIPDPSLPRGVSCKMELILSDGRRFESQVDYPKGSIRNPMTPAEMERKVHLLADGAIGEGRVSKLIEFVRGIRDQESIREMLDLMCLRSGGE